MRITIDRDSAGPLYRQIVEQVRTQIMRGGLAPGAALPTVRSLAEEIGVSVLTVFHAYGQLKELGLVDCKPRQATRVAMNLPGSVGAAILSRLPNEGPMAGYERLTQATGVYSMASSIGDPTLFYVDEFIAELEALRRDSPWNFYYAEAAGAPELLQQVAGMLTRSGLETTESSLIATGGGMQGLGILLDILTSPGQVVLIQEPGRLLVPELLKAKRLVGIGVRRSGSGIDLEHARHCISQYRPKAIILTPDFGHSTGLLMPGRDREACLKMAADAGLFVIEDASCAALRYGPGLPPSLAALGGDSVAQVGSFSYSICPGLRTGYLRLPSAMKQNALEISQATAISGSRFLQVALARYLARGCYDANLRRILPRYKARRDAMLTGLRTHMKGLATWTEPEGGFSTWLTLERGSASALYAEALRKGLAIAPGTLFITTGDPDLHLRLSFGLLEPEAIGESVRMLSKLIAGSA